MFNSWGRDRFWSLGGYDTGGNRGAQKEPYSRIDVIEKNIVVKGAPYVLAATDGNRFKVSEDKTDNNWFYDLGMKINYPDFWENLNYDANSVTADPQFQDTSKNDYTVKNQAIMSSTGAGGLDGVYVENVPENSQTTAFGLRSGDVIKAVNGQEIGKKSNFIPLYNAIEDGIIINMKLIRNQLSVEFNYIKCAATKEVIIDDQDESVTYKGGEWEESTPSKYPSNAVNCMNKTMKYINMEKVADKSAVGIEVPFTGSQIGFISRKERNIGEYLINIKDSKGIVLQSATCSANNGGDKKDQCSIFKSEVFPEGNYTMEIKWKSGENFIVDGFKVCAADTVDVLPMVVEPILITENGVRVTELTSEKALDVEVPLINKGSQDVTVTAAVVLSGNEGVLRFESLVKESQIVKAGESSTITLHVNTPVGSESKRLEVLVYQEDE